MSNTIPGTIKLITPEQQVSDKFRKRDVVITTSEQYPQHILIQFTQDRCDLLNGLQVGQEVTVHYNLRGREWTNPQGEVKYFNSIEGWKVQGGQQNEDIHNEPTPNIPVGAEPGDLPF